MNTKREKPVQTVVIHIDGGVPDITRKDKGVRVVIMDHDNREVGGRVRSEYPSYGQIGRVR